jgi:putative hydrolase of the HAD superfamily
MHGPDSPCFRLYPDTIAGLDAVAALGLPMVVLSNWDVSLHRTLRSLGITDRFTHLFASLEHGVEKPEAELFRIVERETGFAPDEILHVGDSPLDDLQGALGAGWHAALLDRSLAAIERPRIASLVDVPEAIGWIG